MSSVAGEEHPAARPSRGDAGVEPVHHLAADRRRRVGAVGGEQPGGAVRRHQGRLVIAGVELELEAAGVVRPRQSDAAVPGIAEYFRMLGGIAAVFQVDDQPALVEGGAAQGDAERLPHRAAGAVGADQIGAGGFKRRAIRPLQVEADVLAAILEGPQAPAVAGLHVREAAEPVPQRLFQQGLAEGVAARIAERACGSARRRRSGCGAASSNASRSRRRRSPAPRR